MILAPPPAPTTSPSAAVEGGLEFGEPSGQVFGRKAAQGQVDFEGMGLGRGYQGLREREAGEGGSFREGEDFRVTHGGVDGDGGLTAQFAAFLLGVDIDDQAKIAVFHIAKRYRDDRERSSIRPLFFQSP